VDFKVFYTPRALVDLEAIMRWSWNKHPETTERFATALLNHVELLKTFPHLGKSVKHRPGVRQLLHSPLHVYYRVEREKKRVEILQFWYTARK
jgi:plasmid stabilization system protein ParE